MSPYRILASDDNGTFYILASMHSIDKKTGQRNIFIIEKNFLPEVVGQPGWDLASIAYKQVTRKNSTIVGNYRAELNDDLQRYSLIKLDWQSPMFAHTITISSDERTLNSCLFNAMNDFVATHGLRIVRMF